MVKKIPVLTLFLPTDFFPAAEPHLHPSSYSQTHHAYAHPSLPPLHSQHLPHPTRIITSLPPSMAAAACALAHPPTQTSSIALVFLLALARRDAPPGHHRRPFPYRCPLAPSAATAALGGRAPFDRAPPPTNHSPAYVGVGAAATGKGKGRALRAFGAVLRWETDVVGAGQKGRGTANGSVVLRVGRSTRARMPMGTRQMSPIISSRSSGASTRLFVVRGCAAGVECERMRRWSGFLLMNVSKLATSSRTCSRPRPSSHP